MEALLIDLDNREVREMVGSAGKQAQTPGTGRRRRRPSRRPKTSGVLPTTNSE